MFSYARVRIAGLVLALVLFTGLFHGCATPTTGAQQASINVLVDASVGYAVQKGTTDPAVWTERADKIVSIAHQLQAFDEGAIATVPLVTQALQPLLVAANLGPAEMLAANALIGALAQVIQQNVDPKSSKLVTVHAVLDEVINAASVYVPRRPL